MTQPRHSLISLDYTPYYHIISRCVRRAFLCGRDQYAKKNYNHRRQWIKDRIHALQDVFCIDIAAYAIMNNHYHLVIHINKNKEQLLADGDVVKRWSRLFKIPTFIMKELDKGQTLSLRAQILVNIWRKRLVSASWFIKTLNTYFIKPNLAESLTGRSLAMGTGADAQGAWPIKEIGSAYPFHFILTGATRGIGGSIGLFLQRSGLQVVGTATTKEGVNNLKANGFVLSSPSNLISGILLKYSVI